MTGNRPMRINSLISPDALNADIIRLSTEESHHLARVLRVDIGQPLTLFDGQGTRAEALITRVDKKEVEAQITMRESVEPPAVEVTLIQTVCKVDRFEMILQKATELGVQTIQPILTQNTSVPATKMKKLNERGNAIIRNAAQQCGSAWFPKLQPLAPFASVIPTLRNVDAVWIGSLLSGAQSFKESFQKLDSIKTATLLIGPEGDFTEKEINAAVSVGAIPVTFGRQILRTETAAIFGLSVLMYELF